jgi:serine-type D-Ala-D-Ala carboxypeptidase/endopeptidase (penicillin-binding protein 4)
VLDLLSAGLLSFFLGNDPKLEILKQTNWSWLSPEYVAALVKPDPVAERAIALHLQGLAANGKNPQIQGIWIQSASGEVLANYNGYQPQSAASLTKTATTLVSLATWGPNHQFETTVQSNGTLSNGVLQGDLIIQGGGDPFFVWERAIELGNQLSQAGIQRVTGNLVITGNFAMNFDRNPQSAGELLRQGLNADLWNSEAKAQYTTLPAGTAKPRLVIDGAVQVMPTLPANPAAKPLVVYKSFPVLNVLKAMNIYSNNVMSEMMADNLGGAAVVAQKAAELAKVPPTEIQLTNGSGLGIENRLSPRAVSAIMQTTQQYLQQYQLSVADIFPVPGQIGDGESGTLKGRRIPAGSAVKTGTLNEVSAIAGVMPTNSRGLIWFTVINAGTGDVGNFHSLQDSLLQEMQQAWGAPTMIPVAIRPSVRTLDLRKRLTAAEHEETR